MKVGIWSYPSLFQSSGGLQNQIQETALALSALGCDVEYLNLHAEDVARYDVVHMFSVAHGNHVVARMLSNKKVPFVVSPILQSYWSARFAFTVRWMSRFVGYASGWRMRTEYDHYKTCLDLSGGVVALGNRERLALVQSFGVDSRKCHVIPNGIAPRFFDADPAVFTEKFKIQPGYVLCVGLVGPWKNQATVVKAAEQIGLQVVIIGPCKKEDESYLQRLKSSANVLYIGALPYESDLLASAYAAAGVFCLPSVSEVMPLSVLESLAAGTPAVLTINNSMDLSCESLRLVNPNSFDEVKRAICDATRVIKNREVIAAGVRSMSWSLVAHDLMKVYQEAIGSHDRH